jgi:hypothetical protein
MRLLCREPGALGKGLKAFGKDFAESHVAGSRQRLCRRPEAPSAKPTVSSRNVNTNVVFADSRAGRLSAKTFYFFLKKSLCREPGWLALGKGGLCREPYRQALGKDFLFFLKKNVFAESLSGWLSAKGVFAESHTGRLSAKTFFKKKLSEF